MAIPLLGRVHTALSDFDAAGEASTPVFSNYLPLEDLAASVTLGTRRIRGWNPTAREAWLADVADALAERVLELALRLGPSAPKELVHGDF